jgi:hypothetical protein
MRYMLLIYKDEKYDERPLQERTALFKEAFEFGEALRPSGVYEGGDPLEPISTATTVRMMRNGKTVTTDGPFAETKEQLAGYGIVNAKNLDEVLALVARHPLVRGGLTIEVRPIRVGPPKA